MAQNRPSFSKQVEVSIDATGYGQGWDLGDGYETRPRRLQRTSVSDGLGRDGALERAAVESSVKAQSTAKDVSILVQAKLVHSRGGGRCTVGMADREFGAGLADPGTVPFECLVGLVAKVPREVREPDPIGVAGRESRELWSVGPQVLGKVDRIGASGDEER